jgi:hypothetical protein
VTASTRVALVRESPPRTSWTPVDLGTVLDGGYQRPVPSVGRRADGVGVLYPARVHAMNGESEAMKTWVALHLCAQVLAEGRAVLFLDFEDDEGAVVHRLLTLGATEDSIRSRFGYVSPSEPITSRGAGLSIRAAVEDLSPALTVLDGMTEALSLHGLSTIDNDDLARFGRLVTRPLADRGAATLVLDHLTKSSENRGRYALGGVHKLNGLNGAAFTVEAVDRCTGEQAGRSRLIVTKDRPGQLRQHCKKGHGDRYWFADFTLDNRTALPEPSSLVAPSDPGEIKSDRPAALMARVADALAGSPDPLSVRGVLDRVPAKQAATRQALALLVDEGYVTVSDGPRGAQLHRLSKAFEEEA